MKYPYEKKYSLNGDFKNYNSGSEKWSPQSFWNFSIHVIQKWTKNISVKYPHEKKSPLNIAILAAKNGRPNGKGTNECWEMDKRSWWASQTCGQSDTACNGTIDYIHPTDPSWSAHVIPTCLFHFLAYIGRISLVKIRILKRWVTPYVGSCRVGIKAAWRHCLKRLD